MRVSILVLVLFLISGSAFAYTFVLKSGKRLEGVFLYEEDTTIRIEDHTGVQMTLKKSQLDFAAMSALNYIQETDTQAVEEPPEAPSPARTVRQFTTPVAPPIQFDPTKMESEAYWQKQVSTARRSLERLKAACRNAGSSSKYGKVLRTETYWIDGKPVNVTGYWAHPANVENAKRVCNDAIRTKAALEIAQRRLIELQNKRSHPAPGKSR